jgi:Ca2+-binding RTX toxin-like protein
MQTDILQGEVGWDTVNGDAGFDSYVKGGELYGLHGNIGNDTIWAGDGDDTLSGGNDPDYQRGGPGHDHCDNDIQDRYESCHLHPPGTPFIRDNAF